MTLHFMSDKELSRLEILRDFTNGRLGAYLVLERMRPRPERSERPTAARGSVPGKDDQ